MMDGVAASEDELTRETQRDSAQDALRVPGVTHVETPVVTAAEAFDALRAACRAAASGRGQIKFFLDGMLVADFRHPLLPRGHEDRESYFARVSAAPAFAVYCGSIQVHSPVLFARCRALLAGLFGRDWVPDGWIDAELFFGHYAYTPGGLHQESRLNLHWVLDGEKSMLIRPSAPRLNRQDSETWIEQSPEFIEYMRGGLRMIGSDCRLLVPFHGWTKAEMFRKGADLGVNLADTWSCVSPAGTRQDGTCSACRARKAAFQLAGLTDGTDYAGPVSEDLITRENGTRN
jgi:hypothetical protein